MAAAIGTAAIGAAAGDVPLRVPPDQETVWRSEKVCGANCMYVLLRSQNVAADYRAIRDQLTSPDSYTSLTDLHQFALRQGLNCEMARTDPDGLRRLSKPVIAHMDHISVRGDTSGHFVVILATGADRVTVLDGSTGKIEDPTWRDLQRRWSGYVLYIDQGPGIRWYLLTAVIIGSGAVCAMTIHRAWGRRRRRLPDSQFLASGNTL